MSSALVYQSCISEASANTQMTNLEVDTWNSLENAVQLANKDKKKILIDVYTDWCKWCKVMDEKTFNDQSMKEYLKANYHLVKFNAEQKETITFNGKSYSYESKGRRGLNSLATELLDGRLSYPSIVVLDASLEKLQTIRGNKSPKELMTLLK